MPELDSHRKLQLLTLACRAIREGCNQSSWTPRLDELEPWLHQPGACFVTLTIDGRLRGCIGSLEARRPLAEDIVLNARAAACNDPRFPELHSSELSQISVEISLLGTPEQIDFNDYPDLLKKLEPGTDGVIMETDGYRSTYLPSVWEQLSDPNDFIRSLIQKAGLPADYWQDGMKFYRYRTESFSKKQPGCEPTRLPEGNAG